MPYISWALFLVNCKDILHRNVMLNYITFSKSGNFNCALYKNFVI